MKVAPTVVFLFRDSEGFASAISDALRPNPSSSLRRLEDSFELSLDGYGIKDHNASGSIFHFVDAEGIYKVSLVVMQHYEPPVLACAVNEVLGKIAGDNSSLISTLYVPIILGSSQLIRESKSLKSEERKALVYGLQVGQETQIAEALRSRTEKPPPSLRIQHETSACILHLVRVLRLPTFFLIGQTGQHSHNKSTEEFEIFHTLGEILASATGLHYSKDNVTWNPTKISRDSKEPWRALYG
ncbi:MLP3.9 protein [Senna tora]|uniref:MLP3.9 protein n=1 Tax=Senna tora TaxID=362788 RepID=A0A834WPM6_9FABA|nr:MLP3.9 protein [Senna tora]